MWLKVQGLLILVAAVCVSTAQPLRTDKRGGVPIFKLPLEQLKFQPQPPIRGSVATSTDLLFRALFAQETGTAIVFFSPNTVIEYKSLLPYNGIYKGWMGLVDLGLKSRAAFQETLFNASIAFVDEVRGFSIAKLQYSGKFLRTGKELSSSATCYMKWRFGKLQYALLVDDEPETVGRAFATDAEAVVYSFFERLFQCGACNDTLALLAPDVRHTVRLHPKRLADALSYKGVEGFKKQFVGDAKGSSELILDSIRGVHSVFGDNTTVIVGFEFGSRSLAMRTALSGLKGRFTDFTAIRGGRVSDMESMSDLKAITIFKVRDGKIVSCDTQVASPLMPWHLRRLATLSKSSTSDQSD